MLLLAFHLIFVFYIGYILPIKMSILCEIGKSTQKTRIFIPTITKVTSPHWPPSWLEASMGMFTYSYRSSLLRVHWFIMTIVSFVNNNTLIPSKRNEMLTSDFRLGGLSLEKKGNFWSQNFKQI